MHMRTQFSNSQWDLLFRFAWYTDDVLGFMRASNANAFYANHEGISLGFRYEIGQDGSIP